MRTYINKYPAIVSATLLLILIVSGYILVSGNTEPTQILEANVKSSNVDSTETEKPNTTSVSKSQWGKIQITSAPVAQPQNNSEPKPLTTSSMESVSKALKRINLDNDNNVIVDHETLIAINQILDDHRPQLNNEVFDELQMHIRNGLPDGAGEQLAKIMRDYYQYSGAADKYNSAYEINSDPTLGFENTMEEHESNYRVLTSLRELYFDTDVVTNLFSTYDANANYMFDMIKAEHNDYLTDDEKQQMQAEIRQRHTEQSINVENWSERQQDFQVAKKNILMSSINSEDKQAQLTELMHQHFTDAELLYLGHFQLDKQ